MQRTNENSNIPEMIEPSKTAERNENFFRALKEGDIKEIDAALKSFENPVGCWLDATNQNMIEAAAELGRAT